MIYYLTIDEVLEIHDQVIKFYGGLAGIKDKNLLYSCVELPKSSFYGQDAYPTFYDKAAIILFSIVRNHPFNDGNKRTAFLTTVVFLNSNEIDMNFEVDDLEQLILDVAIGKVHKNEIAHFLEYGKTNRTSLKNHGLAALTSN